MKDQITLTDVEYGNRKKTTKREEFLNKMEEIIPWKAWVEMIRPYYPKGEHGRPVRGIETMLRMYLMQTWFNLSDEGTEDAIYDSYAMRSFLGINFMTEPVHILGNATVCNFPIPEIPFDYEKGVFDLTANR